MRLPPPAVHQAGWAHLRRDGVGEGSCLQLGQQLLGTMWQAQLLYCQQGLPPDGLRLGRIWHSRQRLAQGVHQLLRDLVIVLHITMPSAAASAAGCVDKEQEVELLCCLRGLHPEAVFKNECDRNLLQGAKQPLRSLSIVLLHHAVTCMASIMFIGHLPSCSVACGNCTLTSHGCALLSESSTALLQAATVHFHAPFACACSQEIGSRPPGSEHHR